MAKWALAFVGVTAVLLTAGVLPAQQNDFEFLPPVRATNRGRPTKTVRIVDLRQPSRRESNTIRIAHRGQARPGLPVRAAPPEPIPAPANSIPPKFEPWWRQRVGLPLRNSGTPLPVDVNSLVVAALHNSARVRAISDHAIIAETALARADAEFDVHAFMESKFARTSVPTGSDLDAGAGVPRLREGDWFYNAGIRRKNGLGGRLEMSQQIGTRTSNSTFFFPPNQGNARLTLSYNQPLLNGAGRAYNSSLVVLANLDTRIAVDRTASELQDHLLKVTVAHWELYLQRSLLIQKLRNLDRAEVIEKRLEKRRKVDSLASQVARARAAVAMRRTALVRARAAIYNAESRLRSMVNAPEQLGNRLRELIPRHPPNNQFVAVKLSDALVTALENRPEIDSAAKRIESARVRANIAKNQLLPVLDLVVETYVTGLRGNTDIGQAWVNQFGTGEPSYTAGLVFEVPLHRRAARAEHRRRRAELRQLSSQFQATVATLKSDVEVAVREVETNFGELQGRYQSMLASQADTRYLQRRWEALPGDDRSASFLLEDLLDSQDRLAAAEQRFARSQTDYAVSLARLKRATGTLLTHERVDLLRGCDGNLPVILFDRRE